MNFKDETYENIIANEIATLPIDPYVRRREENSDEPQAEEGRYGIFTSDFIKQVAKYLTVYLVSVM